MCAALFGLIFVCSTTDFGASAEASGGAAESVSVAWKNAPRSKKKLRRALQALRKLKGQRRSEFAHLNLRRPFSDRRGIDAVFLFYDIAQGSTRARFEDEIHKAPVGKLDSRL